MSHTETHKGTVKRIIWADGTPTVEEQARLLCNAHGVTEQETYYDGTYKYSWRDTLGEIEELWDHYILIGDNYYTIEDTDLGDNGFSTVTSNPDGSFDYFVQYHNGSASLSECLEDAIKVVEDA